MVRARDGEVEPVRRCASGMVSITVFCSRTTHGARRNVPRQLQVSLPSLQSSPPKIIPTISPDTPFTSLSKGVTVYESFVSQLLLGLQIV